VSLSPSRMRVTSAFYARLDHLDLYKLTNVRATICILKINARATIYRSNTYIKFVQSTWTYLSSNIKNASSSCCKICRQRRIASLSLKEHKNAVEDTSIGNNIFISQLDNLQWIAPTYIYSELSLVFGKSPHLTRLGIRLLLFTSFYSYFLPGLQHSPLHHDIYASLKTPFENPVGKMMRWRKEYIYTLFVGSTFYCLKEKPLWENYRKTHNRKRVQ